MKLFLQMYILVILTTSCTSTYYQLYTVKSDQLKVQDKLFGTSNDEIEIKYNLWSDGGNTNFIIKNKTNKHIYINRALSHIIINGIANTYFKGSVLGYSNAVEANSTVINTAALSDLVVGNKSTLAYGNAVSNQVGSKIEASESITYKEEKIVSIPPFASKVFDGVTLVKRPYIDCDTDENPSYSKPYLKTFDKNISPLHIRNYISYKVGEKDQEYQQKEDIFWISKIANYHKSAFTRTVKKTYCDGSTDGETIEVFTFYNPNQFYIEYSTQ